MKTRKNRSKWIARFLVIVMLVTCLPVYQGREAKAGNYKPAMWFMDDMNITQVSGGDYSHRGTENFDVAGVNNRNIKAPFEAKIVAIFKKTKFEANTVVIQSVNPVQYANGYVDYMSMAFGHDNDISDCYVGRHLNQGEVFYQNGNYGNATGIHTHAVCIKGKYTDHPGWIKVSTGNYTFRDGLNPKDCLFLYSNTRVYNNKSMSFRTYGGSSNPQPVANASIKATSCDKYDNSLTPRANIYNPGKQRITTVGIQIKDGNNVIASKEEMVVKKAEYWASVPVWFECIKECGVQLRPGHVYSWQIYANVGGRMVYTGWINDRTTGTEKPNAPAFNTAKTHYAVGDAVTVSWGADSCATGGYSLTLKQTKGGTYSQTLTTNSANATSLAFTLPSEGEYKITGFARGSVNSDTATLNKTIVAHNPSKVRFVEYDKDGKENLLCEQTVRYGYSATAPMEISRKGHTFIGWKGEYSNVSVSQATAKPQQTKRPQTTSGTQANKTSNRSNAGNASSGSGYKTGSTYKKVIPKRVTGVKVKKSDTNEWKISWKKVKKADHYQVKLARNRAFTKGKKQDDRYSTTDYFWNLRKKKTYYIKVRAVYYNYNNATYYYGKWSRIKKTKIK